MENDTLITIGLIGIGAYAAYRLLKPAEELVGGVGQGITTATSGLGSGIGQTGQAVGQVSSALGSALASDISLLDIPKDVSRIANFAKNLIPNTSPTAASSKPQITTIYETKSPPAQINTSSGKITNPFAFTPNMSHVSGLPAQSIGNTIRVAVSGSQAQKVANSTFESIYGKSARVVVI